MDEFLKQNYGLLTHGVEILAAIVGLMCYNKYKRTHAKFFIYFLVYVALIELLGSYPGFVSDYDFLSNVKDVLEGSRFEKNHWWFTIFWNIGSAMFFAFYFMKVIKTKRYKSIIKVSSLVFLTLSLLYVFINLNAFFNEFSIFNTVLSNVLIVLIIILYFIETLKSDKIVYFYKTLDFYISAPMLIWCLVLTPVIFFNVYFNTADWNFIILKYQIFLFTNLFMYLTFAFALIWCKPNFN